MARHTNYLQLALDLRRGSWLIKDPDILLPVINGFLSRQGNEVALDDYHLTAVNLSSEAMTSNREDNKQKEKCVIIVPLHGSMTKYDTCETYGTTDIAAKMLKYLEDDSIVGFVLDVDSGGGSSNAVYPLVRAIEKIKASGRPIIAHCDAAFSAAYWVASQCDAIFADNNLSGFGSIGAFAQYLDDRENKQTGYRVVTVYAKESPEKNIATREMLDGKPEKMQDDLSKLIKEFHAKVKAGRPSLKTDATGVLTGGEFFASEAISVGLVDGMGTLDDCVQNVFIRAEYK